MYCSLMGYSMLSLSRDLKGASVLLTISGRTLIYLPTYSPDFHPIENCQTKLKSTLRQIGARTYPDLAKAIELAFNRIHVNDIRNWFIHCCYYTSQ